MENAKGGTHADERLESPLREVSSVGLLGIMECRAWHTRWSNSLSHEVEAIAHEGTSGLQ